MKKVLLFSLVFAVALVFTTQAYSASLTSTMDVSASVLEVCSVTTQPILFGDYDVDNGNDVNGAVDLICTPGIIFDIALDAGGNYLTSRRMTDGSGNFLSYEIYRDPIRNVNLLWGDLFHANTHPGEEIRGEGSTGALQHFPAFGRIDPSQSTVPAGAYDDVVNVTIYY